jgi:hypothetical protein
MHTRDSTVHVAKLTGEERQERRDSREEAVEERGSRGEAGKERDSRGEAAEERDRRGETVEERQERRETLEERGHTDTRCQNTRITYHITIQCHLIGASSKRVW